jgi:hypothetical protein
MAVDAILDEVDEWAARRGHSVEREDIRIVLELSRDHLDRAEPAELAAGDVAELLGIFPDVLVLDNVNDASYIVRAVEDLLVFLGETDKVPAGRIQALTEELEAAEGEFLERVLDGLPDDGEEELSLLQQLLAMLGVPTDSLPPMRLPPYDELVAAARTSPMMVKAWDSVASGTDDEYLRNIVAAVEFDGARRVWPAEDDDLAVELWALATDALVAGGLDDPEEEVHTRLTVYLTLFLSRSTGMPLEKMGADATVDSWRPWVDRLVEHGALMVEDGHVKLAPLGQALLRDQLLSSGVEVDLLPDSAELTAEDLASIAHSIPDEDMRQELSSWLALRAPADAARELLAVAAESDAVQRIWATSVALDLDVEEVWHDLLDHETLRPYAKTALGVPLDLAERGWVAVDGIISAVVLGEDAVATVLGAGDEEKLFDAMWRLPHPDAAAALEFIGEYHPDKKIAKIARRAAHKAASRDER